MPSWVTNGLSKLDKKSPDETFLGKKNCRSIYGRGYGVVVFRGMICFWSLLAHPIFPIIRRCEGATIKLRLSSSIPRNRVELLTPSIDNSVTRLESVGGYCTTKTYMFYDGGNGRFHKKGR